jgi:DNA-binding MarR family transcriptional regulator
MSKQSFSAVVHILRAASLIEERFAGELASIHGLSLKELMMLMHLERASRGRLSRVELAKRLYTSASTVTRLAQPLEKRGIVSRESDPHDARLAYVVLGEAGRALVTEARETLQRRSAELFRDRWSEWDVTQLASLLGRLTAAEPGILD